MGYVYQDDALVKEFVNTAHANGFKVITYITSLTFSPRWVYPEGHPMAGQIQPVNVTLDWLRDFREEYGLDGWYFDGFHTGGMLENYQDIKQVRRDLTEDVGKNGTIFLHHSNDVWGGIWSGSRSVFVEDYIDYGLAGEIGAVVHSVNDPYFRYISTGYGIPSSSSNL